jgi:hypothetical protein
MLCGVDTYDINATTMNSETHKVITATFFTPEYHYAVPIEWELKDIDVKWGRLYYKGEQKEVPMQESEVDLKYPTEINENEYDLEQFFDCEEE